MTSRPIYNFVRLPLSLPPSATVSAVAAHTRFLVLGDSAGGVHLLDHAGNERRRFSSHARRVTDVRVDEDGGWVGSASEDGTVVLVCAAHADEPPAHYKHTQPLLALSFAPSEAPGVRARERPPFIVAGTVGKVRLRRRGRLLSQPVDRDIYSGGESPIRALAWGSSGLIAWASGSGVFVIDEEGAPVGFFAPPPNAPPIDVCPPRLAWEVYGAGGAGAGSAGDAHGGGGAGGGLIATGSAFSLLNAAVTPSRPLSHPVVAAGALALLHIAWGDTLRTVAIREKGGSSGGSGVGDGGGASPDTHAHTIISTPVSTMPTPGTSLYAAAPSPALLALSSSSPPLSTTLAPAPVSAVPPPLQLSRPPAAAAAAPQPPPPPKAKTSMSSIGGSIFSATSFFARNALTGVVSGVLDVVEAAASVSSVAVSATVAAASAATVSSTSHSGSGVDGSQGAADGSSSSSSAVTRPSAGLCYEVVSRLVLDDAYIAGVSAFDDAHLAVLCFEPPAAEGEEGGDSAPLLELRIISRVGNIVTKRVIAAVNDVAVVATAAASSSTSSTVATPTSIGTSPVISSSTPRPEHVSEQVVSTLKAPAPAAEPVYYTPRTAHRDVLPLLGVTLDTAPCDLHLSSDPSHLWGHEGLPVLLISSPRDVLLASPRGLGEHAAWTAQSGRLAEAIDIAVSQPGALSPGSMNDLVQRFVSSLLKAGDAHGAVRELARLLPCDSGSSEGGVLASTLPIAQLRSQWEGWADAFLGAAATTSPACANAHDAFFAVLPLPASVVWKAPVGVMPPSISAVLGEPAAAAVVAAPNPLSPLEAEARALEQSAHSRPPSSTLPTRGPVGLLSPATYDLALKRLLSISPRHFLGALRSWVVLAAPDGSSLRAAQQYALGGRGGANARNRISSLPVNPQALLAAAVSSLGKEAKASLAKATLSAGNMLRRVGDGILTRRGKGGGGGGSAMAATGGEGVDWDGEGGGSGDEGELADGCVIAAAPFGGIDGGHDEHERRQELAHVQPLFTLTTAIAAAAEAVKELEGAIAANARMGRGVDASLRANLCFLLDAIAEGHLLNQDPEGALQVYCDSARAFRAAAAVGGGESELVEGTPTGAANAMRLIHRFGLWGIVTGRVRELLMLSEPLALKMLAEGFPADAAAASAAAVAVTSGSNHEDDVGSGGGTSGDGVSCRFPLPLVLRQLHGHPRLAFIYLHALFSQRLEAFDSPYYEREHALLLRLYPRFLPQAMLTFLQRSSVYPLEAARTLCLRGGALEEGVSREPEEEEEEEQEGEGASTGQVTFPPPAPGATPLWRELSFVVSRMGSASEALNILLQQLKDVRGAVDFVVSAGGDGELWADLVAAALRTGDGDVVGALLDAIPGTGLDATKVLAEVPVGMPIPHLQLRLLGLLRDRAQFRGIVQTTSALVREDCVRLFSRLVSRQTAALRVVTPREARCAICSMPVATLRRVAPPAHADAEADVCSTGSPTPKPLNDVRFFYCHHSFHDSCLDEYSAKARNPEAAALSIAAAATGLSSGRSRSASRASAIHVSSSSGSGATRPRGFSTAGDGGGVWASRARAGSTAVSEGGRDRALSDAGSEVLGSAGVASQWRCPLCVRARE